VTEQPPPVATPLMATCDHCEQTVPLDQARPVVITGGQSYAGHLLPHHGGGRRTWLCVTCYIHFRVANVEWLRIEDDEGDSDGA
jgi:hypothetical protein